MFKNRPEMVSASMGLGRPELKYPFDEATRLFACVSGLLTSGVQFSAFKSYFTFCLGLFEGDFFSFSRK
jgi:hypothetical protein